jgi:hypothetical protein
MTMRKLILALTALACLHGAAQAQQQQKFTADQGAPGAAPWPVTWTGQSVLADLRVAGAPVTAGNPVPVTVGNFPATQAVSQSGAPWSVSGTVTANVGTTNGLALDTSIQAVRTALGSPFQAGGSIANTAFGISGTLPAYAATPTFNLGALNGAATAANQSTANSSLASIATNTTGAATAANQQSEITAITTRMVNYADSAGGTIAAGGTFTGAPRDAGSPGAYTRATAVVYATQAGTLSLRACADAGCASYFPLISTSVAAAGNAVLTTPLATRWWQVVLTNGSATNGSSAYIYSSMTTN